MEVGAFTEGEVTDENDAETMVMPITGDWKNARNEPAFRRTSLISAYLG
jgi:hypothetical protein